MQTDIVQLLMNIKLNIAAVEQGERSASVLNEIEADCTQMLELMKLFLISERDSYYGYFLMNLTYEVDFSSRSIAGILLNRFPPVFHTNPLLLCKFTLKEILFIVCHEIDHIVLNHPAEMLKSLTVTSNPSGANFSNSSCQLYVSEVGQTISDLLSGCEHIYTIVCKVFPRPISSARIPPMLYLARFLSHLYPTT